MPAKPNILWLVLDCARTDHLSAHGYQRNTTPHLDWMIETGIDYPNAHSAAIWSLPAYTSLLTGLFPRQHGVNVRGNQLPTSVPTLPHQLRRAGYTTACFSNNAWLSPISALTAGFDQFELMWFSAQKTLAQKASYLADLARGKMLGDVDKGARRTNDRIVRWLREQRGIPSFTFVAYVEPHTPYTTHRKLARMLAPEKEGAHPAGQSYAYEWVRSLPERHVFAPETLEEVRLRYDVEMHYIDNKVKELMDRLRNEGLLDGTLVIVTADHGELLGEHGMIGHQFSVAEPLRRVPLILWGPDFFEESRIVPDLVQTVDLAPLLADWCGAEHEVNPLSAAFPLAAGKGGRAVAITDYPVPYLGSVQGKYPHVDLEPLNVGLTCASTEEHKVVRRGEEMWEGYDLRRDPGEHLPQQMQTSSAFSSLRATLEEYLDIAQPLVQTQEALPSDVRKHLKALGYIE